MRIERITIKRSELEEQRTRVYAAGIATDWDNDFWINEELYGHYPEFSLTEGMFATLPAEEVKRKLVDYFGISTNLIQIGGSKDAPCIYVIVPDNYGNVDELKYRLGFGGWFYSSEQDMPEWFDKEGKWKRIKFEPRIQDESSIRDEEVTLIHVTPTRHVPKILRNGLVPRNSNIEENNKFNYPSRIYFFRGSTPDQTIIEYTRRIAKVAGEVEDYSVFLLDLADVPEKIKFYVDPNLKNYGVYTKDNIRPEWLELRKAKIRVK